MRDNAWLSYNTQTLQPVACRVIGFLIEVRTSVMHSLKKQGNTATDR